MTIRRQVLLAVLPVFAALAIVGNGVTYLLHRQAILAGLQAQAGAFAVGLASMPTPDEIEAVLEGHVDETSIPAAVDRLLRGHVLTGVVIRDAQEGGIRFRSGPDIDLPERRETELGDAGPYQVAPLSQPSEGTTRLTAFAPMTTASGATRAIVAAEIDASLFPREMAALQRRLWQRGLMIVGLGGLIALGVSTVIARELRRLTRAARQIEHGRYTAPGAGMIAEVTELAQTFGVLEDVIGELRTKSQRAFAENEQFRSEQDLLRVFRDALLPTLAAERAGVRVVMTVTPDAAGIFREWIDSDITGARLCFGRIAGGSTLQTATIASAAGRELADRLDRGDSPATALAATARLFPLEVAGVLSWVAGTRVVTRTEWSAGVLRTTEHPLGTAGETQVHHHLPAGAAASVEVYLKRFPAHPPGTCASDLVGLAGTGNSAIVVLSRSS